MGGGAARVARLMPKQDNVIAQRPLRRFSEIQIMERQKLHKVERLQDNCRTYVLVCQGENGKFFGYCFNDLVSE